MSSKINVQPPHQESLAIAKRFAEYGRFEFPVLSDKDNRIAEQYGAFQPEASGKPESLLHGTFVIDIEGQVLWCNTGNKPFLDNQSLLTVIAAQHGLLTPRPASQPENHAMKSRTNAGA